MIGCAPAGSGEGLAVIFQDCIQTQAHSGQTDSGKGKGQAKQP